MRARVAPRPKPGNGHEKAVAGLGQREKKAKKRIATRIPKSVVEKRLLDKKHVSRKNLRSLRIRNRLVPIRKASAGSGIGTFLNK
jgi:hypothetical protein